MLEPEVAPSTLVSIEESDLTVRVINLSRRPDRLKKVSKTLMDKGFSNWERVEAVDGALMGSRVPPLLAGSIGCEMSHLAALRLPIGRQVQAIMVCEDDLEFLGDEDEIKSCLAEFLLTPQLDVLVLGGRPRGGSIPISANLRIVRGLVGRSCYVVKMGAVSQLLRQFSHGLSLLENGNIKGKGDLTWRKLQDRTLFFAAPRKDLARQRADYSDIEGVHLGPR